jgi:hypothetical protein
MYTNFFMTFSVPKLFINPEWSLRGHIQRTYSLLGGRKPNKFPNDFLNLRVADLRNRLPKITIK